MAGTALEFPVVIVDTAWAEIVASQADPEAFRREEQAALAATPSLSNLDIQMYIASMEIFKFPDLADSARRGYLLGHRVLRRANGGPLPDMTQSDTMQTFTSFERNTDLLVEYFDRDYNEHAAIRELVYSRINNKHVRFGAQVIFVVNGSLANPDRPPIEGLPGQGVPFASKPLKKRAPTTSQRSFARRSGLR